MKIKKRERRSLILNKIVNQADNPKPIAYTGGYKKFQKVSVKLLAHLAEISILYTFAPQ